MKSTNGPFLSAISPFFPFFSQTKDVYLWSLSQNLSLMRNACFRIYRFYLEGFRHMTWGRTLWVLILLKLLVIFVLLKLFFFPDFLEQAAGSEDAKGDYVSEQLMQWNL